MSLLAPEFLLNHVFELSLLLSVVTLIFFNDSIFRFVVFPLSHLVKKKAHKGIRSSIKNGKGKVAAKYVSEALATSVFLLYCYFGTALLSEYVFAPILLRMRNFILIVVIVLFIFISYIINDEQLRSKFIKY